MATRLNTKKMASYRIHVLSLPIQPSVKTKLINYGVCFLEDFRHLLDEKSIKDATNLTEIEAKDVIKVIERYKHHFGNAKDKKKEAKQLELKSVTDMLRMKFKDKQKTEIITLCKSVDAMLNGGIRLKEITEIAGIAGAGKTQFCFQLCTCAQIPVALGGMEGEVVFIDVEGTFVPSRIGQIALSTIEYCKRLSEKMGNVYDCSKLSVNNILSSIYLFRCQDPVQLLASINKLNTFLTSHCKVKLLIIDSIAQSLRSADDMSNRNKVLSSIAGILNQLTCNFNIAVILTNQVTSRPSRINGITYDVPSLGELWSHVSNTKIMLSKHGDNRKALMYKSPSLPPTCADYQLCSDGIRDFHDKTNDKFNKLLNQSYLSDHTTAQNSEDKNTSLLDEDMFIEFANMDEEIFCQTTSQSKTDVSDEQKYDETKQKVHCDNKQENDQVPSSPVLLRSRKRKRKRK